MNAFLSPCLANRFSIKHWLFVFFPFKKKKFFCVILREDWISLWSFVPWNLLFFAFKPGNRTGRWMDIVTLSDKVQFTRHIGLIFLYLVVLWPACNLQSGWNMSSGKDKTFWDSRFTAVQIHPWKIERISLRFSASFCVCERICMWMNV